jgi:hypothetical protein
MTAREAGEQLGRAAAPLIVIAIGFWIGRRMGKKREPQQFVVWPVAVAAILAAVMMTVPINKAREGQTSSETR